MTTPLARATPLLALALALAALAACGGGGAPPPAPPVPGPASALAYTDPPATGWRLVRDPASTATRLVLGLAGPAGTATRGVGISVQAPPGLRFVAFPDGSLVQDAGVFELASVDDAPGEPVALAAGLKPGNVLSAGVFQKDRRRAPKDAGATLLRVALELDPAALAPAGAPVRLEVKRAAAIPADIGQPDEPAFRLAKKLVLSELQVAVGTLEAR